MKQEDIQYNKEPFSDRIELVFAPVDIQDPGVGQSTNYDNLLDPNFDISSRTVEDAAIRKTEGRGTVTEDSLAYSMSVLDRFDKEIGLDHNIKQIIKTHAGVDKLSAIETIEAVRINKELRTELGRYFLNKLDTNSHLLPARVLDNGYKNSTIPGYSDIPGLKSREYTSLLAMAQLDGTFDPNKARSEEITYDDQGEVLTGQHRVASEVLLFY